MSLSDELRLYTKLRALEVPCQLDLTRMTRDERRETLRAAVKMVPDVTFTVRDSKRVTLSMQFLAVYGEALL